MKTRTRSIPLAPAPWTEDGPAVSIDDVGVRFLYNRKRKARIRDVLFRKQTAPPKESFWAVRNVSTTIGKGEAVGLIGDNGSGKSTLLKLIAGVLLPDEGTVTLRGEVAPLLELGAGFAADLSGRENIWLAGSIHGLSKDETAERFDAITRFAGKSIREFLDTPVRHYSSGMKVRLGFSIVSQLDHPILLIDEVLAVGDRKFRRRCYRRIEEMMDAGRTLIVVSHREKEIRRFCDRALYMRDGELVMDGPTDAVYEEYEKFNTDDPDDD